MHSTRPPYPDKMVHLPITPVATLINQPSVKNMDSYDEIPYESTPLHETHPEFLATLARLFGIEAAPPANCRVLEIGCAGGGNLIPMAWHYPDSHFIGIELSARQAADGAQLVARLGLDNIEIRQGDLLAFPADTGKFDYIIAHGLYSWVPRTVREKLLQVCREHLAENGIAYISYNTLPGWRWRAVVRDMLLYHTRNATTPAHKLQQAQEFLAQLESTLPETDRVSAEYLSEELHRIAGRHPSYLFHEYLEATNHPFLFSDFITDCRRHDLDYIADAELATMFPDSMGERSGALLEQSEEMVEVWQYMDFLSGRTFRQSLLCRGARNLDYDIDLDTFTGQAFFADVLPLKKPDLRRQRNIRFSSADGKAAEVSHPLAQAALLVLSEHYPDTVSFDDLCVAAQQRVSQAGNNSAAGELDALRDELFWLFSKQIVQCRITPMRYLKTVTERPRASRLALEQNASGLDQIAVAHHGSLQLDPFSSTLLSHLTGTHTLAELVELMTTAMQQEQTLASLLSEPLLRDPQQLRLTVGKNCKRLLELFARNGVLVENEGSQWNMNT